jgi:endonuclease YncB( thermonuclease family)
MATPTIKYNFKVQSFHPTRKKFISAPDGDTINIQQPLRMVSCDTPEKEGYAGKPPKSQPKLDICKERLQNGFYDAIPLGLRKYLIKKLGSTAAKNHIDSGNDASKEFEKIRNEKLQKPDGSFFPVAVIPSGEVIDTYGRMLAYITRFFEKKDLPPKGDPKRNTFNLDIIANGWAAFFPVYPSFPTAEEDFNRMIKVAETAWNKKKGAWKKYGKDLLLAYEYRMCIKLGTAKDSKKGIAEAFQRSCVDIRTMKIAGKFNFENIPPCYRLWVWEKDLVQATNDLKLK